jgi:hypothetical protein
MAGVAPVAVAVSLPSVFLIGAIAVVGLREVLARRMSGLVIAYGGFLAAAGLSVAAMGALGQYHSAAGDRAYFLRFWAEAFPPSGRDPVAMLGWLVTTHTGPLFAYFPGARGTGMTALFFGCFLAGISTQSRRNPGHVLLFVLPFLLTFLAAVLRRYPYGASVRAFQFLTPATLLLAAAGAGWLCARPRRLPVIRWAIPGLAVVLVGVGLWRVGHDLGHPYRTPWDRTSREFARWFWGELAADAELVCVRTYLGINLRPGRWT